MILHIMEKHYLGAGVTKYCGEDYGSVLLVRGK